MEAFAATPAIYNLPDETVALTSSDGIPLKAWWTAPAGSKPRAVVILLPGMDGLDASSLLGHAKFLHDAGYAALALDTRAHGRSGGSRMGSSIEEPRDVNAALDWLRHDPRVAGVPVVLLGVSMGGATALRTAAFRPDVAAVISVSAFCSVNQSIEEILEATKTPRVMAAILTPFMRLAMATLYRVGPSALSSMNYTERIPPRPILILHGTADDQIKARNAFWLASAAGGRAQLSVIEGAGHCVFKHDATGPESALYRAKILQFLDSAAPRRGGV